MILLPGVLISLLTTTSAVAKNSEIRNALQHAQLEFVAKTIKARVELRQHGLYHLQPDAQPWGTKTQGKRAGLGYYKVTFTPGDAAKSISFSRKGNDSIRVMAWCCADAGRSYSEIHIHYGREVRVEDLQPFKLMHALSSLFKIESYDPRAALERSLAMLGQDSVAGSPTFETDIPTMLSLTVLAEPRSARHGDTVNLVLRYDVGSPDSRPVTLTETRMLGFDGRELPGYPSTRETSLVRGPQHTSLPQSIPAAAPAGVYELGGEVCVNGDCIARTVSFEIFR